MPNIAAKGQFCQIIMYNLTEEKSTIVTPPPPKKKQQQQQQQQHTQQQQTTKKQSQPREQVGTGDKERCQHQNYQRLLLISCT